MKTLFLSLLFLVSLLLSCKSTEYTPDNYPKQQLHIGNGGGFSGAINYYIIFEDGSLFSKNIKGEYSEMKAMDKNLAKQLVSNYHSLGLNTKHLNEPGNMYYFLGMQNGENLQKSTWGKSPLKDNKMKTYYDTVMNLIDRSANKK